jgi:hypothetical protein
MRRLGDFEVVRELGRGGMGIVYEALQVSLNRKVALKVLSGSLGLSSAAVQRFRCEAEAAAKLHHTNIVPVYATGEQDGTHFYAMELIDGPSLDHVIRQLRRPSGPESPPTLSDATGPYVAQADLPAESPPPLHCASLGSGGAYFDAVARMVAEVADALENAHQNGVIHRDIKPSNLLLSPQGRLSVNDFGLARVLDQPGMTTTGEFVGTPAYMSPEQIASGRIPVDHRTDIYSLGATLYELLTLQPPFRGQSSEQVLAQIVQKEPQPPRKLNKKVPVDLETICLKALEKDPDSRYQTAGQMAEDLRRFANRFAISARRAGPVQRLVKWARRRPAVGASLGGLLLALAVALAFALWAHHEKQQRQIDKEQADARLRDAQERARLQLLEEKLRNAYQVASSGDLKRTDEAIQEIEGHGASTGQVRLIRGVVAYFRQDTVTAISELERAVQLMPDSVAARAVLAMSYVRVNPQKYQQIVLQMAQLAPSSPEDFLFRGYAREQFYEQGGVGLADLDEGLKRQNSPLGRALRAIARANRAIDTGQPQDAEAALEDANAARSMLPENPLARFAGLYSRLAAAGIYEEAKFSQKRTEVLQGAAQDAQALEPFIEFPNPVFVLWLYFEELGERGKALDVARRSFQRSENDLAAVYYTTSLYQEDKFAEALQFLDKRRKPAPGPYIVMRVFHLAELPNEGPRLALEAYQKFDSKYPPSWLITWGRVQVLLFLGRKEEALAILRRDRLPFVVSQDWKDFYVARHQFERGELSGEAYLAKAGASRWRQFHAHYELGLFRLAEGDRAGARAHFHKAVATRAVWFFDWAWCRMFLQRLENDDKWPPWIRPIK